MITRSKLVEQLRDYQIRYQHKYRALTVFSPKPNITSRKAKILVFWVGILYLLLLHIGADVAVATFWALVFSVLVVSCYMALYFRHFRLSFVIVCFGVFLPIRLRVSRQALAKKRDGRLPLSM